MSFRPCSVALAITLLACNAPAPPVDASVDDAAAPPDAPPTICGTVAAGRLTPMNPACMPRCSHATWIAYTACRDTNCVAAALAADTSLPTVYFASGTQVVALACGPPAGGWSCLSWQTFALAADLCPASYDQWGDCTGDCASLEAALLTCAQADPTFRPRYLALAQMCFAAE